MHRPQHTWEELTLWSRSPHGTPYKGPGSWALGSWGAVGWCGLSFTHSMSYTRNTLTSSRKHRHHPKQMCPSPQG